MRVLIGCEHSGVVRDAFAMLGHDAWSCDLLPCEAGGQHLQCDLLTVLGYGWDLLIAHPDCTYLTCSAEWAYGDGPYHQKVKSGTLTGAARRAARVEAIRFVEQIAMAPIPKIAIENPAVGALNKNLDLMKYGFRSNFPTQKIHPYQFGHDASKNTGLALKGLPDLVIDPSLYVEPRIVNGRPRWGNQTDSGQNRLSPGKDRWRHRARTYDGIAMAMAERWGCL